MTGGCSDLVAFERAGLLGTADVQLARALGRLGGEGDPQVMLGVALASRAPGRAHICADLRAIVTVSPLAERDEPVDPALPPPAWPEIEGWLAALRASPLVGTGSDCDPPRPIVLDGSRVYLRRYWLYQQRLLAALQTRAVSTVAAGDRAALKSALDRLFPQSEQPGGQVHRQVVAAAVAMLRRLTIVSGGPGTGKTTTVKKILALLLEQREAARIGGEDLPALRIALAAPTGKAAARMVEALNDEPDKLQTSQAIKALLPREAFTLHKLLGFQRRTPTRFRHDAHNPLPFDVVVVDEASMVDFALMTKLVEAVPERARLILLGDRDQLASVEAGAVLADICGDLRGLRLSAPFAAELRDLLGQALSHDGAPDLAPGIWDCLVQLDHFYRFGADSGIGTAARTIVGALDRDLPSSGAGMPLRERRADRLLAVLGREEPRPFHDISHAPPERGRLARPVRDAVLAHYRGIVAQARARRPAEALALLGGLCVLCAHRQGDLGVSGMNAFIEAELARTDRDIARACKSPDASYPGRPILVTENDYGVGLMNGDIGIVAYDPDPNADGALRAFFADGKGGIRGMPLGRLPQHTTNFAMTIHKSQGSQYRHAIVILPDRPSPILTRELLYTGLTRARDRATLVAPPEVIRQAVCTRVQRASGLGDKLWGG